MNADRNKGGWQVIAVLVAVALVLLPVVYLLSAGPAALLVNGGYVSQGGYTAIYDPLDAASDAVPMLGNFMFWYVGLWSPPREVSIDPVLLPPDFP